MWKQILHDLDTFLSIFCEVLTLFSFGWGRGGGVHKIEKKIEKLFFPGSTGHFWALFWSHFGPFRHHFGTFFAHFRVFYGHYFLGVGDVSVVLERN